MTTIDREKAIILWVQYGKPVYDLCVIFQITRERMRQVVKSLIKQEKIPVPVDFRRRKT